MDKPFGATSPLLVIGMHRSGTRLLADILADLGVFMGADRQDDSESVTFMRINEAIFHQCAAFWTEPMPVHVMLAQPGELERIAGLATQTLRTELEHYAGRSSWRVEPAPEKTPSFGWKDPRNTFTLPIWRYVFPNLKAIHLIRHGVDAAASLARRHREHVLSAAGEPVPSPLAVFEDHAFGVLSTRRGWTIAESFAMWEQYVEKARLESAELGERAIEVRFETLLTEPERVVSRIARFCGVTAREGYDGILERIDPRRAFAFRSDPELTAFAATVTDSLRRYGYEP